MDIENNHAFPLRNGYYKASNHWYTYILVNGSKAMIKSSTDTEIEMKIFAGDFGETVPKVAERTGKSSYNLEFRYTFGQEMRELAVVSDDGKKIVTKGLAGISELQWATKEEITALENEGDPIEAPPGPYKLQPNVKGKFLWITGPPGLGKSTSAQLLCKLHGYVYYESDCFDGCKNPYIPPDVENPSMAQLMQRPLKGEGLEERKKICKRTLEIFMNMMTGKDYDKEGLQDYYGALCEDISRERKRIGGDWAIAGVALTQEHRDFIRSKLDSDLTFVILTMDMDDVRKRVEKRHEGDDSVNTLIAPIYKIFEPVGENEKNAVNITITSEMTPDDVLEKIINLV